MTVDEDLAEVCWNNMTKIQKLKIVRKTSLSNDRNIGFRLDEKDFDDFNTSQRQELTRAIIKFSPGCFT